MMRSITEASLIAIATSGVTVICVSAGIVFPAHISLGVRVSPHTGISLTHH